MVFEAHCMSFSCTELLLFNYAKVNKVFHSMAPLIHNHVQWNSFYNITHDSANTISTNQRFTPKALCSTHLLP